MQFVEKGIENEKTLLLLPGTCCNWETNFMRVLPELEKKYHLICVNYDGFDGSDAIFPDIITVTEKIEKYIIENHNGKVDGALGSSLGGTFVGQLAVREKIHIDHAIFGSSDLDQSGPVSAKLQSMIVTPLLTGVTKNMAKRNKAKKLLKKMFEMDDESAETFVECFSGFSVESIKNEYYTDLLTHLHNDTYVENTTFHFIYANKMGKRYKKRYLKYFRNPDIREFDMQHEQWLFGGEKYAKPVLEAIDDMMDNRD